MDFVILDFDVDKEVSIISGRPFLATGKTLIDVQKRELIIRVNDQEVKFNVLNASKYPKSNTNECSFVVSLDQVVQNQFHKNNDHLGKMLQGSEKLELVTGGGIKEEAIWQEDMSHKIKNTQRRMFLP